LLLDSLFPKMSIHDGRNSEMNDVVYDNPDIQSEVMLKNGEYYEYDEFIDHKKIYSELLITDSLKKRVLYMICNTEDKEEKYKYEVVDCYQYKNQVTKKWFFLNSSVKQYEEPNFRKAVQYVFEINESEGVGIEKRKEMEIIYQEDEEDMSQQQMKKRKRPDTNGNSKEKQNNPPRQERYDL